jgi:hypothetical protein
VQGTRRDPAERSRPIVGRRAIVGRWVFATHQTEPGFFRQDSGEKALEFVAGVGLSRAITELRDARRA